MISASLLIVIIVAIIVGAITGMVLGGVLTGIVLGMVAGFFAILASVAMRNFIMVRGARSGPDDSGLPGLVVVFALVASVAGGLAADEIADQVVHLSQAMRGAFAGLLSAILMAMLMITYHMNPDKQRNRILNEYTASKPTRPGAPLRRS